jgi:hypothetical protein
MYGDNMFTILGITDIQIERTEEKIKISIKISIYILFKKSNTY